MRQNLIPPTACQLRQFFLVFDSGTSQQGKMALPFLTNDTILFTGDSITDAGRLRDVPSDLGRGYAMIAAGLLQSRHPELNLTFLNRGISGDRVGDLQARWPQDCLDLKPDWVSILIGANDTWRRFDQNKPTSAEDYAAVYRNLLEQIREHTSAKVILCEPFFLPVPPVTPAFREDANPKIAKVRELAAEFAAFYVPFDGLFAWAALKQDPARWLYDGVHPTPAGFALMAEAWIESVS